MQGSWDAPDEARRRKEPTLPTVEQLLTSLVPGDAEDLEDFGDTYDTPSRQPSSHTSPTVEKNAAEAWKMSSKLKISIQGQYAHNLPVRIPPQATSGFSTNSVPVLHIKLGNADSFPCVARLCQAGPNSSAYSPDDLHLKNILDRHETYITLKAPKNSMHIPKRPGGAFGRLELLDPHSRAYSYSWDNLLDKITQDSQFLIADLVPKVMSSSSAPRSHYPALVVFRSDNLTVCDSLGIPKQSQLRDLAKALLLMYVVLYNPVDRSEM